MKFYIIIILIYYYIFLLKLIEINNHIYKYLIKKYVYMNIYF